MGLDLSICPISLSIGQPDSFDSEQDYNEEKAKYSAIIDLIKKEIQTQTGETPHWDEEFIKINEDDLMTERLGAYSLLHSFRLLALSIEFNKNIPEQIDPLEKVFENELLLSVYDGQKETKLKHLIDHSDCDGYYIPVNFKEPIWIDPEVVEKMGYTVKESISVGSSINLLKELDTLNEYLKIDISSIQSLDAYAESILNDTYELQKWAFVVLYTKTKESIKYSLPIIFS